MSVCGLGSDEKACEASSDDCETSRLVHRGNRGLRLSGTAYFSANAGGSCRFGAGGRTITDLRDYYGLDIRKITTRKWVLAGEWIGRTYVDYIADHLARLDREARQ